MTEHRMLLAATLMAVGLLVGLDEFTTQEMAHKPEPTRVVAELEQETADALAHWRKVLT